MNKFILNTEDINSYGFTVLTKGIDLSEFIENPLMLYNHEIEDVLGKWINLQYEFDKQGRDILTGEAEYDTEDDDVVKIMNKIKKGYVLGTSIRADIIEAVMDTNDTMIVTKCLLKEVSITALPVNKKAKKVKEELSIALSYNGINDIESIKEQIKLGVFTNHPQSKIMKEIMENKIEEVASVIEETAPAVEEVTPAIEEVKPVKKGRKVELNDAITLSERLLKMLDIELSETDNEFTKIILSVGDLVNQTKKSVVDFPEYITLSEKVKTLESELQSFKVNEIESIVNEAIKVDKIKESAKDLYVKLSEGKKDVLKALLDSIEVVRTPSVKLSDLATSASNSPKKDYDWYATNSPKELEQIKLSNRPLFDEMFEAKFKTKYIG